MDEQFQNPPDRRVEFAIDRTDIANVRTQVALERTTRTWIRTSLTLATFGFGLVRFFQSIEDSSPGEKSHRLYENAIHSGIALIALGIVAMTLSGFSPLANVAKSPTGKTTRSNPMAAKYHGCRVGVDSWHDGTLERPRRLASSGILLSHQPPRASVRFFKNRERLSV